MIPNFFQPDASLKNIAMKKNSLPLLATLLFLWSCSGSKPVTGLSEADVQQMVNAKNFAFRANQMMPSGGRTRILNETYLFSVAPEQVVADLPYMGRAFTVNYGSTDGGMRFQSTQFDYDVKPGRKNGWIVTIRPRDQADVRECIMNIYTNGSADLAINSNNRQQIRYDGYLQPNTSNKTK
jgi:hypothetical protein